MSGVTDESPPEPGAGLEADGGAVSDAAPFHDATGLGEATGPGVETGAPPAAGVSTDQKPRPPKNTAAGRVWVAIGFAVVLLVLLIIFIAENSRDVTISFLGAKGTISLALAMLIAAVAGALITLLVGTTRILQLRREIHRHNRRAKAPIA